MNDKTKQKPLNDHMDMLIKVIKGEPLVLIQRYKKMNFKNIQEFIFLSQSDIPNKACLKITIMVTKSLYNIKIPVS